MSLKGKFIKWTSKDEDGAFSHVGECIGDSRTMFILMTEAGEMLLSKDDGEFSEVRKPRNFKPGSAPAPAAAPAKKAEAPKKAAKKKAAKATAAKATAAKAKTRKGKPTKIAVTMDVLKDVDVADVTRKEMVRMVSERLELDNDRFVGCLVRDALGRLGKR